MTLSTPSRIRGWVSDQLFGLTAADLGGCLMVKQEDSGVLFFEEPVKLPDWRLTLTSTDVILVEVKVIDEKIPKLATFRLSEVARLKRYAELDGNPLFFAIHWVALDLWTLVPVEALNRVGDHWEIGLEAAMKRDRMGSLLNDRLLGLNPPLTFTAVLEGEADHHESFSDGATPPEPLETGLTATITDVILTCGGHTMVDKREKDLIWCPTTPTVRSASTTGPTSPH